MSFLDGTKFLTGSQSPQVGNFLSSTKLMGNADKFVQAQQDAVVAQDQATQANSFKGLAKTAIQDFGTIGLDSAKNIVNSTWKTYQETPYKIIDDIVAGAKDISKGVDMNANHDPNNDVAIWNITKGGLKATYRPIRDVVNAIFAPISSAIGQTLENLGANKLTDVAGKTIADSSGITDMPAFQQFALQHPNFGEDFMGLVNLVMLKGDLGEPINPKQMAVDIKNLAQRVVDRAVKPPEVMKQIEVQSQGGENKIKINTPTTKHADYAQSQGYEPYTPPENLPTIDLGKPASESLPTIQVGESVRVTKNSKGDLVYEPINNTQPEVTTRTTVTPKVPAQNIRNGVPEELPKIEPTDQEISQAVNTFKASTEKDTFTPGKEVDWIKEAYSDLNYTKQVALGEAQPKLGVPKNAYSSVMKNIAAKNGDMELIQQLKDSMDVRNTTSKGAQEMRATQLTEKGNVVDLLYKLENDRYQQVPKGLRQRISKEGSEAVKTAMSKIKDVKLPKNVVDEILDILICK